MSLARGPAFFQRDVDQFYRRRYQPYGRNIFASSAPGPGAVNLKDNDYLLLSNDPRLNRAQARELLARGSGLQMSGVYLRPEENPHFLFEAALAAYLGCDEVVLCQSGFDANAGLMQVLLGEGTRDKPPVFLDMYAHMSFHVGVRSAGGRVFLFRHNSPEALERSIRRRGGDRGVVVVDSLYSTMGTRAPLIAVSEIARNYGCLLVVDESHALGVFGPEGAGLCREYGVRPDFITASLAKAFGFTGGFAACRDRGSSFLFRYSSLPAIFSSVPAPHVSARGLRTLAIVQEEDWRRAAVLRNSQRLRAGLRDLGYDIGQAVGQVIPLVVGREGDAAAVRDALESEKIHGALFAPPATPRNRALVRLTVNCGLAPEEIDHVLKVFAEQRGRFRSLFRSPGRLFPGEPRGRRGAPENSI